MKCPLCNDTLLPTKHNNGVYAHEYQTRCPFVWNDLTEEQIEVLRDAALGRALRRMPKGAGIVHLLSGGWADYEGLRFGETVASVDAALQAAGLMEVEK